MIAVDKPPVWMDQGLCADLYANPEDWFPEPSLPPVIAERVCDGCPVTAECLAYALEHDIREGTFGGVSETRRAAMAGRPHVDPSRGKVTRCPKCGRQCVSTWMKQVHREKYAGIVRRGRDGICENCLQQIRRDERRRAQG